MTYRRTRRVPPAFRQHGPVRAGGIRSLIKREDAYVPYLLWLSISVSAVFVRDDFRDDNGTQEAETSFRAEPPLLACYAVRFMDDVRPGIRSALAGQQRSRIARGYPVWVGSMFFSCTRSAARFYLEASIPQI